MHKQTCSRFCQLPSEIRNVIYDLGFNAPERLPDGTIDLAVAMREAPPLALLLACASIHHDANELFKASRQRFWEFHVFTLIDVASLEMSRHFNAIPHHIRHLNIPYHSAHGDAVVKMIFQDGEWTCKVLDAQPGPDGSSRLPPSLENRLRGRLDAMRRGWAAEQKPDRNKVYVNCTPWPWWLEMDPVPRVEEDRGLRV